MYPHAVSVSNKLLVKLNALRARITGNDMGGCYISTFRVIHFLKQYKPDIVHLHNVHANFVNFPLLCKYLAKKDIATVITLHDCWYFTGKCTHYTANKCDNWKRGCGNCSHLESGIPSWFRDKTALLFSKKKSVLLNIPRLHIVGCSQWIVNEAKEVLPQARFSVLHNGIDTTKFCPTTTSLKERYNCQNCELILGFANKWFNKSNLDLMHQLIQNLALNQRLVLVGCNMKQINDLKHFQDKVICLPYSSSQNEICHIYNACDIFVNMSQEDTLPTVCLEAQACGVSVLAKRKTGIPETVNPRYGKVLKNIVTTDIFSFLKEIINFDRKKVRECNRLFICENFDKNSAYRKYIPIYEEMSRSI